MAKKQTKAAVKETVVEQGFIEVVEQPVTVTQTATTPRVNSIEKSKNTWEIKDRLYHLKGKTPLSSLMKASNVYYFDEEKGHERELKNTSNQRTCFVDEMVGDQRLEHIIFRNGNLVVPKNKVVLQQLLSLYHPMKDILYEEDKPIVKATNEVAYIELELEALNAAVNLDIDMAEAVMRVELGSKVSEMSSKELKRDLLLYAKRNPALFLELVNDDNVQLRNFGIKATELNIIKLSSDQRHFMWGSNDRKLMTVPFDEHPYSALASWFKTDEGMEVYTNIEKRLS
tara:strand:+ start:362 stop:1216 length:855 start_codon:yes stop_codon:yes gene_type:complete